LCKISLLSLISNFFIVKHSCSIVTIYATLGDEGIIHGFNETEVSTVITSHELMPKLKCILDKLPKVTTIIYFEDQLVKTDLKGFERIRTFSYSDVIQMGIKNPVGKSFLIEKLLILKSVLIGTN
jgi:long-chain acyl-CoA synthetase